jgi:hypothetical protein
MSASPKNILASTEAEGAGTPIAAAWDRSDVNGGGRVVALMDINWLEFSYYGFPDSAEPFIVNLATFLTGTPAPMPAGLLVEAPSKGAGQHALTPAAGPVHPAA